jgi:hypothetical protein
LNRKLVSAKRAEEHGLDVGHVLNVEERTLFVLGIGNDHCPPEVVKSVFKAYGDVEVVTMFKRFAKLSVTRDIQYSMIYLSGIV